MFAEEKKLRLLVIFYVLRLSLRSPHLFNVMWEYKADHTCSDVGERKVVSEKYIAHNEEIYVGPVRGHVNDRYSLTE